MNKNSTKILTCLLILASSITNTLHGVGAADTDSAIAILRGLRAQLVGPAASTYGSGLKGFQTLVSAVDTSVAAERTAAAKAMDDVKTAAAKSVADAQAAARSAQDQLETELEALTTANTKLESQVQSATNELAQHKAHTIALSADNVSLDTQRLALEKKTYTLDDNIKALTTKNAELTSSNAALQKTTADQAQTIATLQEELKRTDAKIAAQTANIKSDLSATKDKDLATLRELNTELTKRLTDKQASIKTLEGQLSARTREANATAKTIANAQAENATFKGRVQTLTAENALVKKENLQLKSKLDTPDASTLEKLTAAVNAKKFAAGAFTTNAWNLVKAIRSNIEPKFAQ